MGIMGGKKTSRRQFFMTGGAALGATVGAGVAAAAAGAGAGSPAGPGTAADESAATRARLEALEAREAVLALQQSFMAALAAGHHAHAAALFDVDATLQLSGLQATSPGGIARALDSHYGRQQGTTLHTAFRRDALAAADEVRFSADGQRATVTMNVESELCTPLRGEGSLLDMARLQGHAADRHWQPGRFEAECVRRDGQWKLAALTWRAG